MRLILLLCICLPCLADMQVYTIPLKHSPPEELIPALEPMLAPEAYITGHRDTLVVRTSAENIEVLKSLVETLDIAATPVLISVRRGHGSATASTRISINGEWVAENGGVKTHTEKRGNSTTVTTRSTSGIGAGNSEFQVRGLSGRRSYITTGEDVPVTTSTTGPYGRPWPQQDYRSLKRGFFATPRVFGEQVRIDISTEYDQQSQNPEQFKTETLNTSVNGRLGEWIPLGNISQSKNKDETGLTRYHSTDKSASQSLYLKVDKL